MNVHIITIGDEILIGQIVDTNSAWMGQQLNLIGAQVREVRSVGDERSQILDALSHTIGRADVVLITGGLGPTKDDITKKVLASFFDTGMVFHQPTYDAIDAYFKKWNRQPTAAHREQCYMPAAAQLLVNKKGSAPGMWFEKDETIFVSMPGVPYEMKYLMEYEVLPRLHKLFPTTAIGHRTILTVGEGESRIAERIEPFLERMPTHFKIAYLPNFGGVRLRLTAVGKNMAVLDRELDAQRDKLTALLGRYVFGQEKDTLEAAV
ncbi:MAG: molybdopterin-binding protein, partial [Bacteroidota bacterium]